MFGVWTHVVVLALKRLNHAQYVLFRGTDLGQFVEPCFTGVKALMHFKIIGNLASKISRQVFLFNFGAWFLPLRSLIALESV